MSDQMHVAERRQRLLLVSSPRTASNLLVRILALEEQPDIVTKDLGGYFFFPPVITTLRAGRLFRPLASWTPEEIEESHRLLQKAIDEIEEHTDRAESQGKRFVTKEHALWLTRFTEMMEFLGVDTSLAGVQPDVMPFKLRFPEKYGEPTFSAQNMTVFPDEYLKTWQLAFVIRHPALMFPSFVRAMDGLHRASVLSSEHVAGHVRLTCTFRWTRMIYDWACENGTGGMDARGFHTGPILLDADDMISEPQVVRRFAELAGLDANRLKFSWDAKSTETLDAEMKDPATVMRRTLLGSSGPLKDKVAGSIDIGVEAEKWKEEFGEEMGSKLERWAREAMPDYEYLRARRVTV